MYDVLCTVAAKRASYTHSNLADAVKFLRDNLDILYLAPK